MPTTTAPQRNTQIALRIRSSASPDSHPQSAHQKSGMDRASFKALLAGPALGGHTWQWPW